MRGSLRPGLEPELPVAISNSNGIWRKLADRAVCEILPGHYRGVRISGRVYASRQFQTPDGAGG
jgi:hypothetical protein